MPKRLAETPPDKAIPEQIGSGPFKFEQADFQPGVRAVYVKNKDYVPRSEPPSWTAGGKVVKVDRVEWITMPDPQTAMNAIQSGDIDFLDIGEMRNPPRRFLQMLGDGAAQAGDLDVLDPVTLGQSRSSRRRAAPTGNIGIDVRMGDASARTAAGHELQLDPAIPGALAHRRRRQRLGAYQARRASGCCRVPLTLPRLRRRSLPPRA